MPVPGMDSADTRRLADIVGSDRFSAACEWAWKTAARTGHDAQGRVPWPDGLEDVPHDLSDPVWYESRDPLAGRLHEAQALYRAMPCYANLMYIRHFYAEFGEPERSAFWREYRALLADPDDRLADPVAYSLWVDYFQADDADAWREATSLEAPWERRMARVLDVSGPVRWSLKAPVYERLLPDRRWHPHVLCGLLGSAFDVYGDIEPAAARRMLRRLRVPQDAPGLRELREKLRT